MNFGAKFSSCCWLCLWIYLYISSSELMMASLNPAPTAVQMMQKKYILDSSMANMVLDEELCERCPSTLVPHKLELCHSLWKSTCHPAAVPVPLVVHVPVVHLPATPAAGGCSATPRVRSVELDYCM